MADIVIMPKLGFNMDEGKLVRWYKQEGDPVKKGEPLFSVETDKTAIDIEATRDGVLHKTLIEEGDAVPVTLPIAIVGDEGEDVAAVVADATKQLKAGLGGEVAESPAAAEEASKPELAKAPVEEKKSTKIGGRLKITPRARRVAKEHGLDLDELASVEGTGYDGGICEKDVLDYLASSKVRVSPVAKKMAEAHGISLDEIEGTGVHGKIMKKDVLAAIGAGADEVDLAAAGEMTADGKVVLEEVPYEGVRKIIGDRLSQSKFTAPHLYFTQKVNVEKLLDIRKQINAAQDHKVSVTDLIARAVTKTLQTYPDMNSALIGDKIQKYKHVNLGIAVAAPGGLIVPVVKQIDKMSVVEIAKETSVLFEKAREGKLQPAEYSGGTFTKSNLGMVGIENFTAIINPPEAGILSISSTKDEAVVVVDEDGNKSIAIKPMMNMTLTVDHRLIDGYLAAQFVTEVKRLLENPIELLI
ncbi:MAG: 2-oxo acid dehydrogenase subunit E2 [Clostridiales bacterium]|nr:2-oxo acid dehydrogenase subunit E2 [Clostridiales bacterium]